VQLYSGVQDAMVQWWYGHNAVGFFLTAGFLGMMYYFVPKQAERPVYSYKLSIIHFWALIFLYIWAGPHHLHYTALPDWASTLGMVFSIILWMPSWGGMINGLMTLSGAWDKLRTDPIIRMMVVSIGFYGMSTFEGPMMSIKAVNSLSPLHRLDHRPRPFRRAGLERHDHLRRALLPGAAPVEPRAALLLKLVSWHFWLATIGIVLYASSMWVTGIMEGLMWREVDAQRLPRERFRRHGGREVPDVCGAGAGRGAVPRRRDHHVLQPVDDRARAGGESRLPPRLFRPNKGTETWHS
jgi:cytochrome c oxidase cbb3-type subunit I